MASDYPWLYVYNLRRFGTHHGYRSDGGTLTREIGSCPVGGTCRLLRCSRGSCRIRLSRTAIPRLIYCGIETSITTQQPKNAFYIQSPRLQHSDAHTEEPLCRVSRRTERRASHSPALRGKQATRSDLPESRPRQAINLHSPWQPTESIQQCWKR